jgi:glutamate 5-kinase
MQREFFHTVKRVVIKVGSSVLTGGTDDLDGGVFKTITGCMARLRQTGHDVVLVSSGAIAAGRKGLHCTERPASIPETQASAAIGQVRLMAKYEAYFRKHDQQIAQVLLTSDDLSNRRKFLNARNTLFTLLQCGIIPIINENDSVVVDEIKFGDNDILSALVTNLVDADLLLILTDQDGLYEQDPQRQKDARLIRLVEKVGSAIVDSAKGGTSRLGTGGMRSKVDAAKKASLFGIPTIIVNGRTRKIISRVFDGEDVGTFFLPRNTRLSSRKYWIAFNLKPKGTLTVDEGAKRAIVEKGKSLLSTGIIAVSGSFQFGDAVSCLDKRGVEFARGLVKYRSEEVSKLKGLHTRDIEKALGYKDYDEIIHRDDLVVLEDELHG